MGRNLESIIDPYIPEQIVDYFAPISGLSPKVIRDYLCYQGSGVAVIIGYPLRGGVKEDSVRDVVEYVRDEYGAERIIVVAPKLPSDLEFCDVRVDDYYRLNLPIERLEKKLRYMVGRAGRIVTVKMSKKLGREHKEIIEEFLERGGVEPFMKYVCDRLHLYLSKSKTAFLLNAYDKGGKLAGFDVIDFASTQYSFYMFNFMKREEGYVPGVSDLLFYELVKISEKAGKKYVNMGLGINEGVRRFKLKWGAEKFLPYRYGVLRQSEKPSFLEIFRRL